MANLKQFLTADGGGIKFLWKLMVKEVLRMSNQLMTWANGRFVQSINGKAGSSITINKDDVGLENVDNTADKDKHVSHAATADNADTLDGKQADDFLLKSEHESYQEVVATAMNDLETRKADNNALTNLDERKVDKINGKGLSTNDYTNDEKVKLAGVEPGAQVNDPNTVIDGSYVHTDNNYTTAEKNKLAGIEDGAQVNAPNTVIDENYVHTDNNYTTVDKNKLAGIEAGAQKNTVTSVAGKTGDITIDIDNVSGLQDALDGKQDTLSFTSTPSDINKVVTQNELKSAVTGKSDYLGTIDSMASLSTTASKGDFYRVKTAWEGVHVGDMIIAEKNNPTAIIDGINWSLMHNEMDTDTTYTFQDSTDGFIVTPSVGDQQKVKVEVKKVNGHSVESDVPVNAKFTDTIIDNVAGDGIEVSGDHGENISLDSDTKNTIANAKSDHINLGGHTIGKNVPADAVFTDTIIDNEAGEGIEVSGEHNKIVSLSASTKAIISDAVSDHTKLGGHIIGKDVPADAVFTDEHTSKDGHYTPSEDASSQIGANASGGADAWDFNVVTGLTLKRDSKGHVVGVSVASKKVPANPNTDHQTDKVGHYTPTDEKTLSPDTSILRDFTRDIAFVGAVHEDEKGHVVAIDTVAILALTNAEIQAIVDEATAEIAAEMV